MLQSKLDSLATPILQQKKEKSQEPKLLRIDLGKSSKRISDRSGSNLNTLQPSGFNTDLNRQNLNQASEIQLKGTFQNRKKYSLVNILEKNIPQVKEKEKDTYRLI